MLDLFDDQALVEQKPSGEQGPVTTKSVEELGGRRDIIVAIDAGHGGEDPGASGPKKLREKEGGTENSAQA